MANAQPDAVGLRLGNDCRAGSESDRVGMTLPNHVPKTEGKCFHSLGASLFVLLTLQNVS